MTLTDERVWTDGTRMGDKIPGSHFFRSWCPGCREPIRVFAVPPDKYGLPPVCDACARLDEHDADDQRELLDIFVVKLKGE